MAAMWTIPWLIESYPGDTATYQVINLTYLSLVSKPE